MGYLRVRVGVYNPANPNNMIEVEGLVDTGAIYTVIRRDILEKLGIKPIGRKRFKAFGGYVERDVGEAGLIIMNEKRTVPIIFGETEDTIVIGVTALEIFGLEVDVVRGTLKEAELFLL